jgi:hypothetical protein
MALQRTLTAVALAASVAACVPDKEPAFAYPKAVIDAHEQAHYKTALWCAYTSLLDSSAFSKAPLNDSLKSTLQGWLTIRRKLTHLEKGSQTTYFRFGLDGPISTVLRLYDNGYRYGGRTARGLPLTVGVWVNKKDGLIDSVLDCDNLRMSPGPTISLIAGRWKPTGRPDRKAFSYNVDQPCKAAFLQASSKQLSAELRELCLEKHIISH